MHMRIGVITYENSRRDAESRAADVLDQLTENQHPFDYYNIIESHKVTSQKGKALIDKRMEYTQKEFRKALDAIKFALAYFTDEEIMEEQPPKGLEVPKGLHFIPDMPRYYFNQIGEYEGSNTWLYDHEGSGIRNKTQLNNVLTKWACLYKGKVNPYKCYDIWITIADVHY